MTFDKNPDYWETQVLLDGFEFRMQPDHAARLAAFRAGQVDYAYSVVSTLSDPEHGLLAARNASIGGQLWVSQLFRAALSTAGVIEVQSATLRDDDGNAISLASTDVVCIPPGSYFDFDEGRRLNITGAPPIGNVANQRSASGGV